MVSQRLQSEVCAEVPVDAGRCDVAPRAPSVERVFAQVVVGLAADPYGFLLWAVGYALVVAVGQSAAVEPRVAGRQQLARQRVGLDFKDEEAVFLALVAHHGIAFAAQPRDAAVVSRRNGLGEGALRQHGHDGVGRGRGLRKAVQGGGQQP